MKRTYAFCIFLFACLMQTAAQTFTLQGRVTDDKNNPIELATVSCIAQGKATTTSLKGEFRLTLLSADSVVVKFSMIGYKSKTRVLRHPKGKQTLQVVLYDDNITLDDVQVKGERIQSGQTQELKTKDMKMAANASGNAVESLVQSQAGVSTHSELTSQYNVRGGSFNENCVYINNIEVYRPFLVRSGQQEGLSIINPDMVERIGFSTGGFEARYGDNMSSALDITYKRPEKSEASLSVSMLGASAYAALANKKVSWLNGIRYKTTKYLLGSLEQKGEYEPTFLDYQSYLNYRPNKRWEVDFIGNISDNHYNFFPSNRSTSFGTMGNVTNFTVYFDGQEKDLFRTFFASFGITYRLSEKTSLKLLASAYHTKEQERYDIQGQYWLT